MESVFCKPEQSVRSDLEMQSVFQIFTEKTSLDKHKDEVRVEKLLYDNHAAKKNLFSVVF